MVVPHVVAEDGTVLEYTAWFNGPRTEDTATMKWDAEILREFYDPEPEKKE
jgi:hypothetical protein